jgi:phosphoribosylamine---glycine ligase
MNILLLGSGGREHALAWKISQSKKCDKLFISPGNPGTAAFGTNLSFEVNDFDSIEEAITANNINLIVVGPEEPLVNGIYDRFKSDRLIIIGPSKNGAQLEGSKAFSKRFMQRHNIPTAGYAEFTRDNFEEGKLYLAKHSLPIVLKADGLAAGKGVVIAQTHDEAFETFERMLIEEQFGKASSKVVIEEFLQGIEVSVFALTDGKEYKIIGHAKDYKRIGEGDTGLNTGGMGCVTPVPFMDEAFMTKVEDKIIRPTINGFQQENIEYKGFVFFGLMNVAAEPLVIEYNCRMGDPETEVVMPRLKNDIVELFIAMDEGKLADIEIEYDQRSIATVVAVSGGYPGAYTKNLPVSGLENSSLEDSIIFHAGTKREGDCVVTNGGRVLAVTSYGKTISEAVERSKNVLAKISFEGMYYRRDIGYEFAG